MNIKPIILFVPAIIIALTFWAYLWIGRTWKKLKQKKAIIKLMRLDEKNGMYDMAGPAKTNAEPKPPSKFGNINN